MRCQIRSLRIKYCRQRLRRQTYAGQPLAQIIMKVAADTAPLFFSDMRNLALKLFSAFKLPVQCGGMFGDCFFQLRIHAELAPGYEAQRPKQDESYRHNEGRQGLVALWNEAISSLA